MKISHVFRPKVVNSRSVMGYLPGISLAYLVLARTVFHQTRYADSVAGLGMGTLSAYTAAAILSQYFPDAFAAREPEESDLQLLHLSR